MKPLNLLILLAFLFTACCQPENPYQEAEDYILKLKNESETVGLSVSVSQKGTLIYSKAFGYESLEHDVKADPAKTRFRIASISKALTSAPLGILMEQGKIDVDQPVQKSAIPYELNFSPNNLTAKTYSEYPKKQSSRYF